MKITKKVKTCGCCGKCFEGLIVNSCYRGDYGLDNKPMQKDGYPLVEQCPNCGYCGFSIEKQVSEEIRETVKSEEYKKILEAGGENQDIYRLQAMLLLTDDLEQESYIHLLLCWIYEEEQKKIEALKERKTAASQMEKEFEEKPSVLVEQMMIYIDCLRQLGEWEQAKMVVEDIGEDIQEHFNLKHLIRRIFEFEKKAIEIQDTAPHSIREV